MASSSGSPNSNPLWVNEDTANILKVRLRSFYNADYFDRVVLPLLDLPQGGRVLDVGCGYGGLSLLIAERRPDLQITGIDLEPVALESAAAIAQERGFGYLAFEQGDAHHLPFGDERFDGAVVQTVLTHVPDAPKVVHEMARVLKPGGVFMAAEYSLVGPVNVWNSVQAPARDEAWYERYFRLARMRISGKRALGRGDDNLGVQVPMFATAAGLDVFDVRLNDRALHVIPPYNPPKQQDYLALLRVLYAPDPDHAAFAENRELLEAAGGTEADAQWLTSALNAAGVRQALNDGTLAEISGYMLFLTFARKPGWSGL